MRRYIQYTVVYYTVVYCLVYCMKESPCAVCAVCRRTQQDKLNCKTVQTPFVQLQWR